MDADILEGLIDEAIAMLNSGRVPQAVVVLAQAKGYCDALAGQAQRWDAIQEDYEAGIKPRTLARRYGVAVKAIYNRAHAERWVSPLKLKRAMRPAKKQVFYPKCRECEQPFEAYSGHALVCPTCKAFKAMDESKGRL